MKIPAGLRQHEGLALALVGGGAAVVVVLRKVQAAQSSAASAAAAPAIPADVLPASGSGGGGGGGPSGSVGASPSATPVVASTTMSTPSLTDIVTAVLAALPTAPAPATPAPATPAPAASAGVDYQAPPGGTQGGSSQVPGSAGGSPNPTVGMHLAADPFVWDPAVGHSVSTGLTGSAAAWFNALSPADQSAVLNARPNAPGATRGFWIDAVATAMKPTNPFSQSAPYGGTPENPQPPTTLAQAISTAMLEAGQPSARAIAAAGG